MLHGRICLKVAALLIKKPVDINATNNTGEITIFLPVRKNNIEMSKTLINADNDVSIQNKEGISPLAVTLSNNDKGLTGLSRQAGTREYNELR